MNRDKRSAALLWLAIISLAACTEHKPVRAPEARLKSAPKEVYEITITMEDSPESLKGFMGLVQYNIKNYLDCIPVDYTLAIGGSTPNFNKKIPIKFTRSEGNAFKGNLVRDIFINENYYGLGVCNWEVTSIQAALDMPDSQLMRLNVSGFRALTKGYSEKNYCLRSEYPGSELARLCVGLENIERRGNPKQWYFEVMTSSRRK